MQLTVKLVEVSKGAIKLSKVTVKSAKGVTSVTVQNREPREPEPDELPDDAELLPHGVAKREAILANMKRYFQMFEDFETSSNLYVSFRPHGKLSKVYNIA